jgi:hypothetical protein
MLKTLSKWFLRILVGLIILIAIALVWYKSAIKGVYGANTEIVDHTAFATPIELTAITHINVLAQDGQAMLPNRTVVIDNGKIISVTIEGDIPPNARVIDGQGKYMIPGLVDSHMHLHRSPNDLLLYVANGVTHIRDLGGYAENLKLREEIEQGRVGPRMFVTSPPINTKGFVEGSLFEFFSFHKTARDVKHAEEMIKEFVDQGYDAIKTYHLDMPSYRAVNKLAAELGIWTVGHFPLSMELSELKITQQREIAHIEEIVSVLIREFGSINDKGSDEFLEYVESRSNEVIDDLLAKDIAVNSVLLYMENIHDQFSDLELKLKNVPLEYANPALVEGTKLIPGYKIGWLPGYNQFEAESDPSDETYKKYDIFWRAREKAHHVLLKAMIKRDVKIVAGSDSGGFLVVPGFALHKELQSLNQGGMSAAQTLATATKNPAVLMNSNAGTIEVGKRADLLLLNKNPLTDIKNTQAIDTVILNGRIFNRQQLNAMLKAVEDANERSRKVSIDKYL